MTSLLSNRLFPSQMLQGTLREVRFSWPDQGHETQQGLEDVVEDEEGRPLEELSRTDLRLNDVAYINGK